MVYTHTHHHHPHPHPHPQPHQHRQSIKPLCPSLRCLMHLAHHHQTVTILIIITVIIATMFQQNSWNNWNINDSYTASASAAAVGLPVSANFHYNEPLLFNYYRFQYPTATTTTIVPPITVEPSNSYPTTTTTTTTVATVLGPEVFEAITSTTTTAAAAVVADVGRRVAAITATKSLVNVLAQNHNANHNHSGQVVDHHSHHLHTHHFQSPLVHHHSSKPVSILSYAHLQRQHESQQISAASGPKMLMPELSTLLSTMINSHHQHQHHHQNHHQATDVINNHLYSNYQQLTPQPLLDQSFNVTVNSDQNNLNINNNVVVGGGGDGGGMVGSSGTGDVIDESVFSLWTLEYMSIIGFYSLIMLVGLAGNLLVCRVAFGSRQMRTTTNLLIASLACSDIVMIVFNIPFNVVRMLPISWPFWNALCILAPLIQYSCVYVSTFTMTLIALHRLWMVRQRSTVSIGKSSNKKLALMVAGIWLMALTLSIPHAAFNRVKEKMYYGRVLYRCKVQYPNVSFNFPLMMTVEVLITQYLLPLSITLIVYVKIGIVIARQGALICKLSDERKRRQSEAKRRRIFMLALAVATFATCWAPINLYVLLVDMGVVQFNQTAFIMCHWFAMSSVCYNPIIYCWLNEKFRNGAKQSLRTILEFAHLSTKRPRTANNNNNNNSTCSANNQIIIREQQQPLQPQKPQPQQRSGSSEEDGTNISTLVTIIDHKRNGSCKSSAASTNDHGNTLATKQQNHSFFDMNSLSKMKQQCPLQQQHQQQQQDTGIHGDPRWIEDCNGDGDANAKPTTNTWNNGNNRESEQITV